MLCNFKLDGNDIFIDMNCTNPKLENNTICCDGNCKSCEYGIATTSIGTIFELLKLRERD
ncbi:MAG: hypothetical protein Q4F88_06920 [Eubacteriales bacterium]|nr:hypothetical protein [Eubacteriales bacterium]